MESYKNNLELINDLKEKLATGWLEKTYESDTLVIDEYEKATTIYYVVSGVVCVEILNDGQQYISSFIFQNDFFGLDSFSTFKQKSHSIRVISEQATIFSIPKDLLFKVLNDTPVHYELLLANFADIFQRHYGYFNFLHLPTTERVKIALTYLSDYIGILNEEEHLELPKFITQEVLSKFCRTSQSRISVSLNELEKQEWLVKRKVPITIN
ncbi:cyclic nucleotide-binding protein [Enterococcus quebecensis]|uniref:Cyclic nucleotide-binding protein n=1 Tax=Enterococcus quebecensis TaxID=903983 RepID=A0A1E5H421_9ENTE|nr:cyclic nucleotide-binding protein [Enterococcus quebecensis]